MPLKTILITGCGLGGIGSALAKEFHLRGHTVFASGRSPEEIDPELIALGCHTLVLDVTSQASIDRAAAFLGAATGGRLDMLINNAGILQVLPWADTPVEEARRVFEVNVFAVWAVSQAMLPALLAARGTIVSLCSINEVLCPPFHAAYNASKAAVESLSRTMRNELSPLGVKVVMLKTGSVRTKLFDNAPTSVLPEGSMYTPLKEWIEGRGFTAKAPFADLATYARDVANELLREKPRLIIWKGGLSTIAWLLSWLGWEGILDGPLVKGNELHKLSPPADQK
ncbi:short-chain dehydrogenase/reductase [Thozetella sp. PMI_491]|nr:short-chain dehydrogenase/reductase [Thozetella sp. PMI_491]